VGFDFVGVEDFGEIFDFDQWGSSFAHVCFRSFVNS
jgi:hypothetical protein